MNQGAPDIFKDRDYQDSMKGEIDRGVEPETLDKLGYQIYGETPMPIVVPNQIPLKTEDTASTEPVAETPLNNTSVLSRPKRRLQELPGRSRGHGRVNHYDQPVNTIQARRNMTVEAVDRQNAINAKAAEGLAILRQTKGPKTRQQLQ